MKASTVLCAIVFVAFFSSACSSDPSDAPAASGTKSSSKAEVPSNPEKAKVTVAAFLRGSLPDEAAAKAFEQGMELALTAKASPNIGLKFLSREQGTLQDPSLKPLLSSGSVPLVVYWQTSDVAPIAPTLKESDVLGVPVWNVTKMVTGLGTSVFGFGYSTERSFAEYAKYAGRVLKSYRFGVISSSAEPFATQSKAFIEETKSLGNTVVFDERAELAGTNFAELIARAKRERCDTIFAVLPGESLVALVKAARAEAFSGKILVGDSFFAAERATLGKDADGIYLMQAWSDDEAFRAKYLAKFGSDPDGIILGAAALGYDFVNCIDGVGANPDSGAISYAWLSNSCEGLTGKTQFSGERIAQRQKRIVTVAGENFKLAQP